MCTFIDVTWIIHFSRFAAISPALDICVTWLIHMCDMTHSYVWDDSCIRVTWLIKMCDMAHSFASCGAQTLYGFNSLSNLSFNSLSKYLKRKGAKPRPCYTWICHVNLVNEHVTSIKQSRYICEWVTSHIWKSHVAGTVWVPFVIWIPQTQGRRRFNQ